MQFTAFLLLRAGVRAAMRAALVLQCGGVCAAYCSLRGVTTSCWMLFGVVWCCLVLFTVVCVCRRFRDARRGGVRAASGGVCAAMRAALVLHAALVLQCVVSFGHTLCLCVCVFVCLIAVCRGFWSVFQVISVISVILGVCAVIGRLCCFVVIVQFLSEI